MWISRDQKPAPSTSAAPLTSRGIEVDDHGGERQEPPDVDRDHRRHREISLAEPHGPVSLPTMCSAWSTQFTGL